MQTTSRPNAGKKIASQSRTVLVIGFCMFALAGLLTGFAVGAFIRFTPKEAATHVNQGITIPPRITGQNGATVTVTTVNTAHPIPLGYPVFKHFSQTEAADGATTYSVTIQAVDQAISKSEGNPVRSGGITCKLWLTTNVNSDMPASRLGNVSTLQNPFPQEASNVLVFAAGTPQTQNCNAQGQASWDYTVSPSAQKGMYYLVGLTDWQGVHYNWYLVEITIT